MTKITNANALQAASYFELKNIDIITPLLVSKGVYKITNIQNGKFYIGATTDCFLRRWQQHQCGMQNFYKKEYLSMTNVALMQDFLLYGSSFYYLKFEIVVNMPTASDREIFAEEARQILNLTPHYNIKK